MFKMLNKIIVIDVISMNYFLKKLNIGEKRNTQVILGWLYIFPKITMFPFYC